MAMLAQEKYIQKTEQLWTGYFNQTRLSNKWGIYVDAQLRTKDHFFRNFSLSLIRPGISYYVNENLRLTAGYAYFTYYAQDNFKVFRPERRLWQQLQWNALFKKNKTRHYLRLEERYLRKIAPDSTLADGYNFNYRIRYNFLWQLPLTKNSESKAAVSLVFNDEIQVNLGKAIVYNYFDQNRFFAGLIYNTSARDYIQLGYLNVFQQMNAGNVYRSINAVRILYFQSLDFRKKTNK